MKNWTITLLTLMFALTANADVGSAVRSDHPAFNKATDILIAQFDNKPDADDIHAQTALGCILNHSDADTVNVYAVMGAYGKQGGVFINSTTLFTAIYGPEGADTWTDANSNWTTSVTRIKNKVKPILQAGGRVWVQEAGQADITEDWLRALHADGISVATTQSKIIVVQHSEWNENNASAGALDFVKANATYVKIDDGNSGGNGTPDYNLADSVYLNEVNADLANPQAKELWTEADRIIDASGFNASYSPIPGGGVDFSDCVENWWILDIGSNADTVRKFWDRYVTNLDYTEFQFSAKTDVVLSTAIESDVFTLAGLSSSSAISISGGQYAISSNGGASFGAWTSAAGTISNGNKVKVRVTSSASKSTTTTATLTVAGLNKPFSVTTIAEWTGLTYQEAGGVVVMEVESAPLPAQGWAQNTVITGSTSTVYGSYYVGTLDKFSTPGTGLLEYKFVVTTPGDYQLQWRSFITDKNFGTSPETTEHNDSFARMLNSNGQRMAAFGPVPNWTGSTGDANPDKTGDNWYKIYTNTKLNWAWHAKNQDDASVAVYWPLAAGTYTFQISVRSAGHAIDRILLWNRAGTAYGSLINGNGNNNANNLPVSATIGGSDTTPVITTTSLTAGLIGTSYSQTLAVSLGDAPFTWSVINNALPDGLFLNSSTGQISGTPTTLGVSSFTIQVTDSDGDTDSQALSISIIDPKDSFQHLDATVSASVTGSPVTQWADQSGNNNHAITAAGSVLYPRTSRSASGRAGLDFGPAANSLELFSAEESKAWLDFTGAASANDGFAVLVAFKCDELFTNNANDVIGNASGVYNFGMRYNQYGTIQAYLGGVSVDRSASPVQAGDTVVYAFNYDAVAGSYAFWDSKNDSEITKTVAATNFSKATAVTVGRTDNAGRYFKGMVGEVKVFNTKLSSEEFQTERNALVTKWVTPQTVTYSLTVNNGSGSGFYVAGSNVVITAGAASANQVFDAWVLDSGIATIVDTNAATTTLTMSTNAVVVTATYKTNSLNPGGLLIQHLDATVSSSVTGSPVSQWADQSGNTNHAIPAVGSVLYPSTSRSASGRAGLDFGLTANSLELFSSEESKTWLDFTGAASANSGFAVLVAFKCDNLHTNNANDVIGNASGISNFGMRYNQYGTIQAYLGGAVVDRSAIPVQAGDTVVYAFNYDAVAGSYAFWDSKNGSEVTKTIAATNFSKATGVTVGRTDNPGRYFEGMVGEVKVFNTKLSSEEFQSARDALVAKWITDSHVSGYDVWAATDSIGAATADDDGDGRVNLLEYAIGGNPKAGGDTDPVIVKIGNSLQYSFKRRNDDPGLIFILQGCPDLMNAAWTNLAPAVSVNSTEDNYDNVTLTIQIGEERYFTRLMVSCR